MFKFITSLRRKAVFIDVRSLCTDGKISNNRKFRSIVPDPSLLDYLDRNHLGYCAKRKMRRAVAKKYAEFEPIMPPTPFPFANAPKNVRKIVSAELVEDIPAPYYGKHKVPEVRYS